MISPLDEERENATWINPHALHAVSDAAMLPKIILVLIHLPVVAAIYFSGWLLTWEGFRYALKEEPIYILIFLASLIPPAAFWALLYGTNLMGGSIRAFMGE